MGIHDDYGKSVLRSGAKLAGLTLVPYGSTCPITDTVNCNIDAVLKEGIAVEIESRVNKQVRGAMLDLLWHPLDVKLMVLIPVHMGDAKRTKAMCEAISMRFAPSARFSCHVLLGTGDLQRLEEDIASLAAVLAALTPTRELVA